MSRTARFIITALLLLSSGVLLSTPPARSESLRLSAILSTPEGLRYQVLRYGDIDLATQAGSEALYRRINRSATTVCQTTPVTRPVFRADIERCRQNAISIAVAAIGTERLVAIHAAHSARRMRRG
jgi:UrcA family protein